MQELGKVYVSDMNAHNGRTLVPYFFRRSGVLVTPHLGGRGYVVTHAMTGGTIMGTPTRLDTAVEMAEAILPLADWENLDFDAMASGVEKRLPWADRVGGALAAILNREDQRAPQS
jgi:hypothetical protein